MGIYLADQTLTFLQAVATGAVLALLFDAFRISRIAIPTGTLAVFVEDVLYFLVCAVVTFALLMGAVEGQVRFFLLIGQVLGAVLYFLTLGRLVMAVSKTIIGIIKGILRFFYRWFLRPVWRLAYHIVALVLRPVYFFIGITKKSAQKWRFRLKVRRIVVYNHFKVRLFLGRKKSGVPGEHEKREENA